MFKLISATLSAVGTIRYSVATHQAFPNHADDDIDTGSTCGHLHRTYDAADACQERLQGSDPWKWNTSIIMDNRGHQVMVKVSGGKLVPVFPKQMIQTGDRFEEVIADNKLTSRSAYDRFSKLHPELHLPTVNMMERIQAHSK